MFKLKQKLSLLALMALVGTESQVQARGDINVSTVNWGQAGATGAAILAGAAVLTIGYKWWNRGSSAGMLPGLVNASVAKSVPAGQVASKDQSVETKSELTQGWFDKWVLRRDDLPQIQQELLAQKLSSWKNGPRYGLESGACLATKAAETNSTILTDFLQDNGFKFDDLAQLNQVKSKLQAEQAALRKLSMRLAAKIDKQALQTLNNYLATKKAATDATTVVSFGSDSLQQADIFAQADLIVMSKGAVSWQEINTDLTKAEGGMCSALIAKDKVKYTKLIHPWIWALVHYGRAKALEKLVDAQIKGLKADDAQEAAKKQKLIAMWLRCQSFLTNAARVAEGANEGWLMIHPNNAKIINDAFSNLLTLNGYEETE